MAKGRTVTVRLTAGEARELEYIAKELGVSRSEALRRSISQTARRARAQAATSLHDRMRRFAGSVATGHGGLSEDVGRRYAEALEEKHRGRKAH